MDYNADPQNVDEPADDSQVRDDPLCRALERAITALGHNPRILIEKQHEWEGGLNSDEINRLAGEAGLGIVFQFPVERDGDTVVSRSITFRHPGNRDPVTLEAWNIYTPRTPSARRVARASECLRAWQRARVRQLRIREAGTGEVHTQVRDAGAVTVAIERAVAAVAHGLAVFRRIHDLRAFGVGAIAPAVGCDDPLVVGVLNDVRCAVETIAPLLVRAMGRNGVPLDLPDALVRPEARTREGHIGSRGRRLCGALLLLVEGVERHDSGACLEALERLDAEIRALSQDIGGATRDATGPRAEDEAAAVPRMIAESRGFMTLPRVARQLAEAGETNRDGTPLSRDALRSRMRRAPENDRGLFAELRRIWVSGRGFPADKVMELAATAAKGNRATVEAQRAIALDIREQRMGVAPTRTE